MEQVLKPSCEMKSFHSLFFGTVFVCCFKYEVREAFFFFFQRKVMKGQVQPRAALVRQLPSFVVRERNGRCRHTVWHGESREMLIDSVSLRFPGFENQFSCFFFFQEHRFETHICFLPFFSPAGHKEAQGLLSSTALRPMDEGNRSNPHLICSAKLFHVEFLGDFWLLGAFM